MREVLNTLMQGLVEELDVVAGGALLRSIHGRRTLSAHQRVVDVAGEDHCRGCESRVQQCGVHAVQVQQGSSSPADLLACSAQEPGTQRLHHPGATIGARAASDAEDERSTTCIQRSQEQLTGAVGRRRERCKCAVREPRQPRCLGKLQDRLLATDCEGRFHRFSGGALDGCCPSLIANGEGRSHGPVTAVSHRELHHVDVGTTAPEPVRDRLGCLNSGEAPLELVGCDDDLGSAPVFAHNSIHDSLEGDCDLAGAGG